MNVAKLKTRWVTIVEIGFGQVGLSSAIFNKTIPFFYLCALLPAFQSLRQRDRGAEDREIDYGRHIGTQVDCIVQTVLVLFYD